MDAPAHPDAAAVADGHPGRALCGVEQRGEDGPVGDRVAAVEHPLGLPGRRGDGGGVHVVPAQGQRADLTAPDKVVETQADLVPFAEAEPADAGRQPLRRDAGPGEREPPFQRWGVDHLQYGLLGAAQVFGVAAEADPAVRPDSAREDRAYVLGHESGEFGGPGAPAAPPGRAGCCRTRRRPSRARAVPADAFACASSDARTAAR